LNQLFKQYQAVPKAKKNPWLLAMGWFFTLSNLTSVGLAQTSGFRFFSTLYYSPSYSINRVHGDGIVSTTHYFTQVTAFTPRLNNNGFRSGFIQHDCVGFRTIHNAQSATFFSNTFFVIYPRYVIHLKNLLI
jgi:hypothetical protein